MERVTDLEPRFAADRPRTESSFENIKKTVAEKMKSAAAALREKSRQANTGTTVQYGNQAADMLEKSADYVNSFDPDRFKAQMETKMRQNPGRALLIAGAAGLALGILVRRR